MSEPTPYVLGTEPTERDRLVRAARAFADEARSLLERIGVQPGWRTLDIGCGPLGILDLLSERVGEQGQTVGLDREPRFLEMARELAAEWGLGNVELVQGEMPASGLPPGSFDLVHARFVLIHSPIPEQVVVEMARLVRPGGVLALQDYVMSRKLLYPPLGAYDRLEEWTTAAFVKRGLDPDLGARLPALLADAGLVDIHVAARAFAVYPTTGAAGGPVAALYASAREDVIAQGIASREEFDRALDELRAHLNNPAGTLGVSSLLMQAWGRRPSR
jgi:SAM-dependent methyltransferase